jgi:hypothetical protein
MLYNIIFKSGSNKIEKFANIKEFGKWWVVCVRLGIHNAGTVLSVKPLN